MPYKPQTPAPSHALLGAFPSRALHRAAARSSRVLTSAPPPAFRPQEEGYASVLDRLKELMAPTSSEAPAAAAAAAAPPPPVLPSFDLAGVVALIRSGAVRRIVCMCGAGISVSAGIPDFRSPGSGLYHRLEAYNLPYPQVRRGDSLGEGG